MRLALLNRRVHYWAALLSAAPLLVIAVTGILLQLKKHVTWVQPAERRGVGREPVLAPGRLLEVCRGVPEAQVGGWDDISRVDLRPDRGIYKVSARNGWEVQVDAQTGEVLQAAYRRSDVIESLHDGSWFHDWAKLGLFLPAGVVLIVLWATGMYLFLLPYAVRWRRTRKPRDGGPGAL